MAKQSAGILVFRHKNDVVEVLLVHPAGPFWGKKDIWSIPKGETNAGEDLLSAAKREFKEEVGAEPPSGILLDLGQTKQSSKTNFIWAVEGDFDTSQFECISTFEMEWPPKSGTRQVFPENDRAAWFSLYKAKKKLFKGQVVFIDRLAELLFVDFNDQPPALTQASLF